MTLPPSKDVGASHMPLDDVHVRSLFIYLLLLFIYLAKHKNVFEMIL